MRFLLSIGVLVLHAANSIAAADRGINVFRHDNKVDRPNITAALGNPDLMVEFWRNSIQATSQSINAFSQKMFKVKLGLKSGSKAKLEERNRYRELGDIAMGVNHARCLEAALLTSMTATYSQLLHSAMHLFMADASHNRSEEVMKDTSKTLLWSPVAASMILSVLSFWTSGEKTIQIRDVLSFPNEVDEAKLGFAILAKQAARKDILLNMANKIFYSEYISISSEFMHIVKKVFRCEADSIALDRPIFASKTMNKWCEKKTNRRIRNVMHRDDIGAQTMIVLLSAAYFKGTWLKQFDTTEELQFYIGGGQKKEVTAMIVEGNFRFGLLPELQSRFVELPYKTKHDNQTVSMFIILPSSRDGLDNLEKKFHGVTVEKLISGGGPTNVKVVLPQFKIESKVKLNKPLASIGMQNALEYSFCNQTIRDYYQVDVIKVVQKIMIEVDDLGSEPAIALDANRPKIDQSFIAMHPFLAVIATTGESPVTLAVARYKGPQ